MEQHEEKDCKYKPARCPSLTCPVKPAFANLLKHIEVNSNLKEVLRGYIEIHHYTYSTEYFLSIFSGRA